MEVVFSVKGQLAQGHGLWDLPWRRSWCMLLSRKEVSPREYSQPEIAWTTGGQRAETTAISGRDSHNREQARLKFKLWLSGPQAECLASNLQDVRDMIALTNSFVQILSTLHVYNTLKGTFKLLSLNPGYDDAKYY